MHTIRVFIVVIFFTITAVAASVALSVSEARNNSLHSSPNVVTTMHSPPTASQVASELHCTYFRDTFSQPALYTIDSGHCKIGDSRYGINTFPSKAVRNQWLAISERLGISPKWESATWVAYPATMSWNR